MKNKNITETWNITKEQINILSNCQRMNDILYIPKGSKTILTSNTISQEDISLIYINENFNYELNKDLIVHNLGEILKPIKTIKEPIVKFSDSDDNKTKISITDIKENIKCNFMFATDSYSTIELYNAYKNYINKIKDSEVVNFKFTSDDFENIRKFASFNQNTISFNDNEMCLYDNSASEDFEEKDNVRFKMLMESKEVKRFDIDIKIFKLIEPGNYEVIGSSIDFLYFNQTDGSNQYIICCNTLN